MTFQHVHITTVNPQDARYCGDCRLCFGDLANKIPALFPSAHWETDACFDEDGRTFRCPECIEAELVARDPIRVLRRCGLCGGRGYLQEGPDGTGSPGGCFAGCPGCAGQGNPPGWALVPLAGHVAVPTSPVQHEKPLVHHDETPPKSQPREQPQQDHDDACECPQCDRERTADYRYNGDWD